MSERKYRDLAEWRAEGGLQEANRLHFHPHGLALEVTVVKKPTHHIGASDEDYEAICAVLRATGAHDDVLERVQASHLRYEAGEEYLSGIWDSRDDPEGVIFGEDPDDKRAKAEAMCAERQRHALPRARLFGQEGLMSEDGEYRDNDIEPLDFVYEPGDDEAS